MTIRLQPHQKIHISSSADIFNLLQPILRRASKLDRNREHLWLLCLDQSRKVLHLELIGLGTVRSVLMDPMEVYSVAIGRRASAVALIHNHPSGNLKPSFADRDMTNLLQQLGRMLRIPLLDHLIISETEFYSFNDSGELIQLAKSTEYLIQHPLQKWLVDDPGMQDSGAKKWPL